MPHCKRKIYVAVNPDLCHLAVCVLLSLAFAETVALESPTSGIMFMTTRLIASL